MTATPLDDIHLPGRALTQLANIDVRDWIEGHAIEAGSAWWAAALHDKGFDYTVVGDTIRRDDIFALADDAIESPPGALTLLWNSLAWGSDGKRRKNKARIASVARNPDRAGTLLQGAARLSRTDPRSAYDLLYPRNRTAIPELGPSFFTKYLYFAGGGAASHPCCILDENVALALRKMCGWESLPTKQWRATAYERYATLLSNWVIEQGWQRLDIIERWLFEEGKRIPRPRRARQCRPG